MATETFLNFGVWIADPTDSSKSTTRGKEEESDNNKSDADARVFQVNFHKRCVSILAKGKSVDEFGFDDVKKASRIKHEKLALSLQFVPMIKKSVYPFTDVSEIFFHSMI